MLEPPLLTEGESNRGSRRADWVARHLDERTRALLEADARLFVHQSVSSPCLTVVRRAEGAWLEDTAGRRYMDFHGNSVHHVGYGHPRLRRALAEQVERLPFAPRRFTCEPAIELAARLTALAPDGLDKVLLAPSGSDAIDIALKLARAATGRFKTVSFWDAFHGAGFGGASVGGEALFRSGPAGPLLPGTEHVAPFDCYRCPYGHVPAGAAPDLERCRVACAGYLEYVLEREGDVAAVIAEPTRAIPYVPPPGFWRRVRAACDAHGALLVFDEIPTGLGKTGRWFACEHEGVVPDILVLGKSLGGAMVPIAATLVRADLDVAGAWAIGHYTHEKSPLTCRVALETLAVIEEEGLVGNAARLGERALARLRALAARSALVGDVRGRGLLLGVEIVRDRATREPAPGAAEAILYRALERGLSFKISRGNVLTLSPPLNVADADLDTALDILEACVAEVGACAGGPERSQE